MIYRIKLILAMLKQAYIYYEYRGVTNPSTKNDFGTWMDS